MQADDLNFDRAPGRIPAETEITDSRAPTHRPTIGVIITLNRAMAIREP